MGLLDDAIREHLDLKRRRGADPSEIAREEQEALGPPRRSAEPLAASAPGPTRPAERDEDEIRDDEDDIRWEDGAAEDAPTAFARPLTQDPPVGARGSGLSPIDVRHVDDGEDDSSPDVEEEPADPEAVEPPPAPVPEPEWQAPPPAPVPEPEWQAPPPELEPEPEWNAPPPEPEPEPEWNAPPPEPEPVSLGEPAGVGDELDLDEFAIGETDEFAIGETDEFAFEDEDFFGDDLDVPRPSVDEPPIEPFPGPPAPTLEPPAPDPEPSADPHRADPSRSPRPPATPPGGFPAADPGASPDQGDPLADSQPESHGPPEADQPTQQYSVADLDEATRHRPSTEPAPGDDEEASEGEDLLEETPEFLEETPEHDRLWFEQKPPRDFDF